MSIEQEANNRITEMKYNAVQLYLAAELLNALHERNIYLDECILTNLCQIHSSLVMNKLTEAQLDIIYDVVQTRFTEIQSINEP